MPKLQRHKIRSEKNCSLKSDFESCTDDNHFHTHTVTHKPDSSEQSWGPSLMQEGALSCFCGCWVSFLVSLRSPSSNSILASFFFPQHAITTAKVQSRPQRVIRITYPFIVQDTHLAKQQPSRGTRWRVVFLCDNHWPAWSFLWHKFLCHSISESCLSESHMCFIFSLWSGCSFFVYCKNSFVLIWEALFQLRSFFFFWD